MNKKLTLFLIIGIALWFSSCKKEIETPVKDTIIAGGTTIIDPLGVDTASLITGWWQPDNYLVQRKVYFGADKFFYIDSLNQNAPYSGTWSFENNVIRCKTTFGDHVFKYQIVSVTTNKLNLKEVGVGVIQPFSKTADPAITSPKLLTFAGTGISNFSGDGGLASAAGIVSVSDMIADKWGDIYFGDNTSRIRKISVADGKISTIAGTGLPGYGINPNNKPALITNITAIHITIDDAGNVYYASEYVVYKITKSNGLITQFAGGGIDTRDGVPATKANIGSISGIVATPNGDIYIADNENSRIKKVSGGILNVIAATEKKPNSIAIDKDQNIYFTDQFSVKKLAKGLKPIITIAGKAYTNNYAAGDGGPASKAMFKGAYGITVSAKGDIFVSDANEHTVRKIDATTQIITKVAGTGFDDVASSGLHATATPLSLPRYLTTDLTGNTLYINSNKGYRILKVAVSQ